MPLDTDDLAPLPKPKQIELDMMSVEALTERIAELEREIAHIRALIVKKLNTRNAGTRSSSADRCEAAALYVQMSRLSTSASGPCAGRLEMGSKRHEIRR